MSRLSPDKCRHMFADSRIARFASVTPDGAPHLVPVTCALGPIGGREAIVFAIDHKPKSTTALRRLANIAAEPRASFLVDHYSEDWTRLWWVRADVVASVLPPVPDTDTGGVTTAGTDATSGAASAGADIYRAAVDLLAAKYPQYRSRRPSGAVVLGLVARWTGWSAGRGEA